MVLTLRDVVQSVFRRRWLIATVLCGAVAAGVGAVALSPQTHRAEAWLQLRLGPEAGSGALERAAQAITTPDAAERAAARFGAPQAAALFSSRLDAEWWTDGRVRLGFEHADGRIAVAALEAAATSYRDLRQTERSAVEARLAQADTALAAQRRVVEEARARIEALRNRGDAGEDRRRLERLTSQLADELRSAEGRIQDATERLDALRAGLIGIPATVMPSEIQLPRPELLELRNRLLELQMREQQLLTKYTESSHFVVAIRDEVRRARELLRQIQPPPPQPQPNPLHLQVQQQIAAQEAQLETIRSRRPLLTRQLAEAEAQLRGLDGTGRDLGEAVAALAAGEAQVQSAQQAVAAARTARDLVPQVEILRPATLLVQAPGSEGAAILLLAILAGIAAGLGLALLADHFSRRFATPEDLERRLGIPVLTSVMDRG